ncbi:unnamed protein product [Cyprideis torosa]|uniref:Uncharacterized protein n=1 Tax=Cyprideis torosa TaxID=163714 RepID=A0A7R8WSU1_9CRUS|nr:unnamed protein product [Cyprideis torosa]CAG0905139.1 unnamed protein product [Cyprideis torosa]
MTRSQTRKGSTPTSTPPTVPGLTSRTRRSGNRSPREPPRSPPPRQSPVVLPVLVDRTPRKRRAKDACAVERRPADSTTPDVPPGKNAAESEDGVSENVPSNDVVSSTREEDSGIVMLGATLNGTASSDEDPVGEWRGIPVTKNVSPTSGIALKKFIIAELGSSTVTSSLSVKLSRLESSVIETWTKKTTEEVSGNFGSQEMGDTAPASHSGNNPRRRTRWQCADQQTLPSPADPLTEDGDLPFPVPPSSPVGVEEYAPFVFRAGPNSPGGDDCLFDDDIPKLQSRSRSFRLPLRTGVSFSPITLLRSPMVDGSRLPDSMAVSRSLSQLNLSASDLSLTRPLSKSCLSLARPEGFCEAGSSESGSVWESVKRRLFFKRILKWFGHGESK